MTAAPHAEAFSPARRIGTLLTLAGAAAVSQSFGRFTYSLLYADMRDGFSLSNTVAGALGSLNLLLYVVGSLVVALTVGRTGLSGAVRIGLAGNVAGLALLAWSPNVGVAAFALALTGFCAAGVWVGTPGLAAELLGPERRGAAAGWMTGGVGSGMVAAAAIDALLSRLRQLPDPARLCWSRPISAIRATCTGSNSSSARRFSSPSPPPCAEWARTPGRTGFGGARAALAKVPRAGQLITAYTLHAFVVTTVLTFIVDHLEGYADLFRLSGRRHRVLVDRHRQHRRRADLRTLSRPSWQAAHRHHRVLRVDDLHGLHDGLPPARGGRAGAGVDVSAFIFGTAFTGIITSIAARVSDNLSGDEFGAAYGVATILFGLGLAAGPWLGGVQRPTGSTASVPAFGLAVAACVLGIVLTGWGDDPVPTPGSEN